MVKACVIAGTHSGCGKTSVSLGLMAALRGRGLRVQPFKVGPDFIDPGHHARAAGLDPQTQSGHNLDGWMLAPDTVREIFARYARGADAAVVEGVMGLFDGFSAQDDAGSTTQIAKLLGLPVILVVDARSMARSAAALVAGFAGFDPDLSLAGVIFNNVGSDNHANILTEAMAHALPEIPVLGCLRRDEELQAPSRHLGLVTAEDCCGDEADRYGRLGRWVEEGLDLDALLSILADLEPPGIRERGEHVVRARIGVARGPAFCFYYRENLRLLEAAGAEIVPFSPLDDRELPPDLDGLYFGGGYPELRAFDLAQNTSMRKQVARFARSGRPVYAECGGFMYLMDSLDDTGGRTFPMTGLFPFRAAMGKRFAALGYREVRLLRGCPLGPSGTVVRGHEFHYSFLHEPPGELPDGLAAVYAVADRRGPTSEPEGWLTGNALGSYIHLHFGSNPEVARHFVDSCATSRDEAD